MKKVRDDIEMKKKSRALGGGDDYNPTIICCGAKTWFRFAAFIFVLAAIGYVAHGVYLFIDKQNENAIYALVVAGMLLLETVIICCALQCDHPVLWCVFLVCHFCSTLAVLVEFVNNIIDVTKATDDNRVERIVLSFFNLINLLFALIFTCAAAALACCGYRRKGGKNGKTEEASDEICTSSEEV